MAKLTTEVIKELYLYGKKVYAQEIGTPKAADFVTQKFPGQISKTSAEFYINLYSELVKGKGSTWNQNSELLLYYVENITLENGIDDGNNAMAAALKPASQPSTLENTT